MINLFNRSSKANGAIEMSLNLTLQNDKDGPHVQLWQTPTWITFICLSYDPETGEPDGGHEAVRRRYNLWVDQHTIGSWNSREDLEYEMAKVKKHIDLVNSVHNPHFSFI